jgi:ribosomal protein S18 acetylase RimI-like enzyme
MSGPSVTLEQVPLTEIEPVVERVVADFAHLLSENCGIAENEALSSSRRQCGRNLANMEDQGESDIYAIVHESIGIAGYVWLAQRDFPAAATLHILDIWIAEEQRRKGFARQAIDLIVAQSRQRGIDAVTLNVFALNAPAIALYENLGFENYAQSMVLVVSRE